MTKNSLRKLKSLAIKKLNSEYGKSFSIYASQVGLKTLATAIRTIQPGHDGKKRETVLRDFLGGIPLTPNEILANKTKTKAEFSATPRVRPSKYSAYKNDDFLKSFDWRKLRMQVIVKRGNRCECCGASPADGIKINVDHIKPRKLFPELALEISNLQILCEVCNHGKGNWDQTKWGEI